MRRPVSLMAAAAILAACGPLPDPRSAEVDLRPPLLEAVQSAGPTEIRVVFDEEAALSAEKTRITPPLPVTGVFASGREVVVKAAVQTPGRLYTLEAEAQDGKGNTSAFLAEFYGFNGQVPRILINEFTPRGSDSHPDIAELRILTAGDMGGVVLYQGTAESFDGRLVFPAFAVRKGSYILVHFKPAGDPAEKDETSDPTSSGGFDASPTAWDFWVKDGTGIGGNNGVLSLYERPGGKCIDAVLYSNRTSQSDEKYRGFGSTQMLARADGVVRDGGWKAAGDLVLPDDALSPEGSTATRSLCRSSDSGDSDGPEDWHVVPTRKSSFGSDNSDEVWTP